MEGCSVKKLSAKSLAKLKKGMPIRLMKGEGTTISVTPENYGNICRSFAKGRGLNMRMSPEEVAHNHGKGLFDKLKSGASKVGKVLAPVADKLSKVALEAGANAGKKYIEKEIAGGKMAPIDHMAVGGPVTPSQRAGALDADILDKINELTGQKLGALAKSNLVQSGARTLRANMERAFSNGLSQVPRGNGLFAGPPAGGEGIHPRHHLAHHSRKMIERSSIGASGNLLGMPPALMSQPYSANFQFSSHLPPAYSNQIKSGRGLY